MCTSILVLAALALPFAAAACAAQAEPAAERLPLEVFAYDRTAPLELREGAPVAAGSVSHRPVSFAGPRGGRATGVLVVPDGPGPFAGILLMHGAPGSAERMLPLAAELSEHGAVVLALDAPFARRGGPPVRFTPADSAEQVQLVVELQRGVDLLLARPDVDPERLAFVGRSYGGTIGALLAGVERRLKTYVLGVADGGLVAHVTGAGDAGPLGDLPAERMERWLAAMRPIEPSRFVGRAPPASILFQSARRDELVRAADAEALHRAARQPYTVRWYDAGHRATPEVMRDQLEWLHRTVGTRRPE
ncbi:MAG TPA: hypothetical protein VHG51_18365 [Longimicrobiaceae bacterium]|nr:hypothetical protein [Longimicrobiaceae bacterium]